MARWAQRIGCFIFSILFVHLTGETNALSCYNCGWSPDPKHCMENSQMKEERNYPLPDKCLRNVDGNSPPNKTTLEKNNCKKIECDQKQPACMKWSFLSGSSENITYMCVGNPGGLTGCYQNEISEKDDDKKPNRKTLKVEVCLCNKDNCNGARHTSTPSIFVFTALTVSILLRQRSV